MCLPQPQRCRRSLGIPNMVVEITHEPIIEDNIWVSGCVHAYKNAFLHDLTELHALQSSMFPLTDPSQHLSFVASP